MAAERSRSLTELIEGLARKQAEVELNLVAGKLAGKETPAGRKSADTIAELGWKGTLPEEAA